jgi:hypothetical protein
VGAALAKITIEGTAERDVLRHLVFFSKIRAENTRRHVPGVGEVDVHLPSEQMHRPGLVVQGQHLDKETLIIKEPVIAPTAGSRTG